VLITTGVATVKLTGKSDAISSGGSVASTSWTLVWSIVKLQVAPAGNGGM
jgi:hypothetical protein